MAALYNDTERFACDWLQHLMDAGLIMAGTIDDRSIADLSPDDLVGYERVHLFAGIGGWDRALHLADWPIGRPVWTCSCPCPPFSQAGKRQSCERCASGNLVWCPRRTGYCICADCGHAWLADGRHLWPEAWRLIARGRPPVVFGEQVSSPDGREWLAGVRASLEILSYAPWGTDYPAAGVGSPNIRQRIWWVADADGRLAGNRLLQPGGEHGQQPEDGRTGRVGEPDCCGRQKRQFAGPSSRHRSGADGLADTPGRGLGVDRRASGRPRQSRWIGAEADRSASAPGDADFWTAFDIVHCTDEKARRIPQSALQRMADGLSDGMVRGGFEGAEGFPLAEGAVNRVGRLKGYGNAINPFAAARFIRAWRDVRAA